MLNKINIDVEGGTQDDNFTKLTSQNEDQAKKGIFQFQPYLDEQDKVALRNFQYHGGCTGYLYIWFWSPAANWLVEQIPRWVAPNLLTIIGTSFIIAPWFYCFWAYGTSYSVESTPHPFWFNCMLAVAYFIYRMFDEMDGKQARRTGNSSALGLMFDHGCDAFTIGYLALMMCKLIVFGDGALPYLFVTATCFVFYMSTLEEYYIGGMFLGPFNAVSEGFPLLVSIWITIGWFTPEQLNQELIKGHPLTQANWCVAYLSFIIISFTVLSNFWCIYNKSTDNKLGEKPVLSEFALNIFVYILMTLSLLSLAYVGPDPIIDLKHTGNQQSPMFYLCLLHAFIQQHLSCHLMIVHTCDKKFNPLENKLCNFIIIASGFILATNYILPEFLIEYISIFSCIKSMLVVTVFSQAHVIYYYINEIAECLSIRVFKVKPVEEK